MSAAAVMGALSSGAGSDPGGRRHAVWPEEVAGAVADRGGQLWAVPVCRADVRVLVWPELFSTSAPGWVCEVCRWRVGLRLSQVGELIEDLVPEGIEGSALRRLLGDRRWFAGLATVVWARARVEGWGPTRTAQMLARVSAHAPTVAPRSADCWQGWCEHRPEDVAPRELWDCPFPDAALVCFGCSAVGEWVDEFGVVVPEWFVPGPCEVARSLAASFGVAVPAVR
jgi:hypothetical protein